MDQLNKIVNIIGVVFALWFAITSWIWTYNAALMISYPFGLLAVLILLFSSSVYGKKAIKILLIAGLIISMIALLMYR